MGATLRSLWHWSAFAMTALFWLGLLLFLTLFREPRSLFRLIRRGARAIVRAAGIRLEVLGADRIPTEGVLLMGNHVNLFEPFLIFAALPSYAVGVEKASNFKLPVYGRLTRRMGNVPIVRENLKEAKRALDAARAVLATGVSIAILPEGTRSGTGAMGPFKKGPFHLAIDAQAPVVPFAFVDNERFYDGRSWHLHPRTVKLVFGSPIPTAGLTKADLGELSERVRADIQALIDENRAGA